MTASNQFSILHSIVQFLNDPERNRFNTVFEVVPSDGQIHGLDQMLSFRDTWKVLVGMYGTDEELPNGFSTDYPEVVTSFFSTPVEDLPDWIQRKLE